MTQTPGTTGSAGTTPARSMRVLGFGIIVAVVGILLAVLGSGWEWAVGLSMLALSAPSMLIGLGLPSPATIAQLMADEPSVR